MRRALDSCLRRNDESGAGLTRVGQESRADGGFPLNAEADALHVAVAATQEMDYLLTWNCQHINNAETNPIIRTICMTEGTSCPEICTPQELLPEETNDVPG